MYSIHDVTSGMKNPAVIFVWLIRNVIHTMPWPKIFLPGFVTVDRMLVTWLTILEDGPQSTFGEAT